MARRGFIRFTGSAKEMPEIQEALRRLFPNGWKETSIDDTGTGILEGEGPLLFDVPDGEPTPEYKLTIKYRGNQPQITGFRQVR